VAVLCGSLLPSRLETLPARKLVGPIRFCTLECPDTVLAGRLRRRPAWRGTSTKDAIARHQRFAAWLRAHIQPCAQGLRCITNVSPDASGPLFLAGKALAAEVIARLAGGDDHAGARRRGSV
jgi:hypothetical protein